MPVRELCWARRPCSPSEDICSVSIPGRVDQPKFRQDISSLLLPRSARFLGQSGRKGIETAAEL